MRAVTFWFHSSLSSFVSLTFWLSESRSSLHLPASSTSSLTWALRASLFAFHSLVWLFSSSLSFLCLSASSLTMSRFSSRASMVSSETTSFSAVSSTAGTASVVRFLYLCCLLLYLRILLLNFLHKIFHKFSHLCSTRS